MSEEKQNDQQTSNAVSVIEHAPEKIWIEMEAVQKCPPDFRTNRYIFRFPNAIYGGTVDLMFKIRLRLKQDADKGQFRKILFQEGRPFDLTGEKGIDPKIAHWVAGQNLNPDGTMAPMMQASKDKHGQLESVKCPFSSPASR